MEQDFEPTWDDLKALWMGRFSFTSFVEKHEYELGFDRFKDRHSR